MPRSFRTIAALVTLLGCADGEVELSDDPAFPVESFWAGIPESGAALITNNYSDTVSVVDLGTGDGIGEFPVGLNPVEREGPHHDAVSPDGAWLYVGISNFVPGSGSGPHGAHGTGSADGYALRFDTSTLRFDTSRRISRSPGDLVTDSKGSRIYYSHYDLQRVIEALDAREPIEETYASIAILEAEEFDIVDFTPVCATPHGLRLSRDESELYVACYNGDQLAVVDTSTFEVQRVDVAPDVVPISVAPARYNPNSVHVSPSDGRVWAALLGSLELRVWDPKMREMDDSCVVSLGGAPYFGMFIDEGAAFVLPVQRTDRTDLVWVDAESCSVSAELALDTSDCVAGHMLMVGRDGEAGPAYLVCEGDRSGPGTFVTLSTIATADATVTDVVPVGVFPDGVALLYPGLGINPP